MDITTLSEAIEDYMKTVPMGPSGDDDRLWDSVSMAEALLPAINAESPQGLEQGRLWGLRAVDGPPGVVLYAVETGLPTLFSKKYEAEAFQKKCKAIDVEVEILELEIIKNVPNQNGG